MGGWHGAEGAPERCLTSHHPFRADEYVRIRLVGHLEGRVAEQQAERRDAAREQGWGAALALLVIAGPIAVAVWQLR